MGDGGGQNSFGIKVKKKQKTSVSLSVGQFGQKPSMEAQKLPKSKMYKEYRYILKIDRINQIMKEFYVALSTPKMMQKNK